VLGRAARRRGFAAARQPLATRQNLYGISSKTHFFLHFFEFIFPWMQKNQPAEIVFFFDFIQGTRGKIATSAGCLTSAGEFNFF